MLHHPVVFVADLHLHNWKSHSRLVDGVNSRLEQGLDCLRQARAVAARIKAGTIVVAGDLFHVRGVLKPSVLKAAVDELWRICDEGFQVLVMPGNHDFENFSYEVTSVDTLCHVNSELGGRVTVVTSPISLNFPELKANVVPYIHKVDDFKAAFVDVMTKQPNPDYVVIHQGIDNGDSSLPMTGLTPEWLEEHANGAPVFSGHYHRPFQIGKVTMIGAPYHQTFSDEGADMGCWALFPEGRIEFYPFDFQRFVTVTDKFKAWGTLEGAIVRVKAKSLARGNALTEKAQTNGAFDVVMVVEKEFKTAHEKVIELATPEVMLSEFIDLDDRFRPNKEALMNLFRKVCVGL